MSASIRLSDVRNILREVSGFLLAATCAGCDAPGLALCDRCGTALRAEVVSGRTPGGLAVFAGSAFEGVPARVIRAIKEDGTTSLASALAPMVQAAAATADPCGRAAMVPVPTSRSAFRRRGFRVPEVLLRRAGLRPMRLLAPARAVADQRGLTRAQRAANVRGSMRLRRGPGGRDVVIFDDVTTSGATFDEAARVLRASGFRVLAGVAAAATPSETSR